MSTLYSVGQMNQLGDALEAAGYTPDDVTKLRSSPSLADIKLVLLGRASVQVIEHLIDCDDDPFTPSGFTVESHQKGGQLVFDPAKVLLHLSKKQQNGGYLIGNDLRKELRRRPVLNANVLDYLLKNSHLIPEEWKGKYVFFWGTVYRLSHAHLYVRYLYFREGRWSWDDHWLGRRWRGSYPAALRAS